MRRRLSGAVFAVALGTALLPGSGSAATFPVGCTGTTGDVGSLIGAVDLANSAPGPDKVALDAGCTYSLPLSDNNWYGPNGLPEIKSDVTIVGNGATITRSGSAPQFRFFFVGADSAQTGYVSPGARQPHTAGPHTQRGVSHRAATRTAAAAGRAWAARSSTRARL